MTQVLASLRVNSKNPSAFVEYLNSAMPLIAAAGGQVAKRIDLGEQLIGDGGCSLVLLVDYPNREAVDAVFSSQEYQELIPVRDRAFLSYHVSIVETAAVPVFA